MISRLTALAATFAVLTTATLAFAATSVQRERTVITATAAKPAMPVIQLETIVIVGHRQAAASN